MSRFIPVIARTWLAQQIYGWRFAPNINTCDNPYVYVKAMLYTAGADDLQSKERAHIQGLLDVMLVDSDPDLMQFVEHFSCDETIDVKYFLGRTAMSKILARVLLYDAVKAACSDGVYNQKERKHVHYVAKELGVPDERLRRIERISMREGVLATRKAELLRRPRNRLRGRIMLG